MLESRALLSAVSGAVFQDLDVNGIRNTDLIQGDEPDVIFIIDASGSTANPFTGASVGDLNGDGNSDTILDAEIAAFTALNQQLIELGFGQTAEVGIVVLSNPLPPILPSPLGTTELSRILDMNTVAAGTQWTTTPQADSDNNGISDVVDILRSIQENGGWTSYASALSLAADLTGNAGMSDPSDVNVIMLSDGNPIISHYILGTFGLYPVANYVEPFADELAALQPLVGNLRAFGAEAAGTQLTYLEQIDPDAQIFSTSDELVDVFAGVSPDQTVFTEPGIDGVVVELLESTGTVVATSTTSSIDLSGDGSIDPFSESGLYSFDLAALGLPQTGDYSVRATAIPGTRFTTPVSGTVDVTLSSIDQVVRASFGLATAHDFGDAPTPYPVTVAQGGPQHIAMGPTLGPSRDHELDGVHSVNADADGADEDGVIFGAIQAGSLDATVTVNVQGGPAKLDAWIDFNGDGNWGGPGEHILASVDVVNGNNVLTFDVPADAASGPTYARFRLSTAGDLGVGGAAADGEVEDYQVTVVPPAAGSGAYVLAGTLPGAGATQSIAVDLDNDGDMDVVGSGTWKENDGTEAFTSHNFAIGVEHFFVADVDGDGDRDILTTNAANEVYWQENDGSQNFTSHLIGTSSGDLREIIAVDIDGDGDLDVVTAPYTQLGANVEWYENDGSENFTLRSFAAGEAVSQISAADIDGDGDLDLLTSSHYDYSVTWHENDGNQNFTSHRVSTDALGAQDVTAVDIDGDGDMDLLAGAGGNPAGQSSADGTIVWYENDGNQNFTAHAILDVPNTFAGSVFAADADGDGDIDVLANVGDTQNFVGQVAWYINDGNQNFAPQSVGTGFSYTSTVSATDIDQDGNLDVLGTIDSEIVWFRQDNAPTITQNSLSITEGQTLVLSSSDLNATDTDDTPDNLTYTVSNVTGGQFELVSNPGVAITTFTQQQINNGEVAFAHDGGEVSPGYDVSVSDGVNSTATSTVTIDSFTNVNDAPAVATPIGDVTVNEDAADQVIDLSGVFADVDSALTLTAVSGDGSVVTTSLVGTDLTLSFPANANGTATVTVTADDGSLTVSDTFSVTVSAVNDAPTVANPIADVTVNEDAADQVIDLSGVFADVDSALTLTAVSSDGSVVTTSLSGTDLTLSFPANANGTATVTVTADDGSLTVSDTFSATVSAVNDAPTVANPIADVSVNEDAANQVIDLSGVFADIDSSLTLTAVTSDGSVVTTSLSGTDLTLSFPADANGSATVTVTADDGALTASDTFSVTVSAVNDAPTVANPIADVTVNEDAADQVIDLSGVFADVDSALTLTAVTSDGSVVTTSLSGTDLTLSFPANANGTATVTVTADDGSLTVSDTFTVTVSAVNDAPMVANPIADVTVNEDTADQVIDLSGVFADVDSSLTLTAVSSDGSVVTTSLVGTDLTLSFPVNANGSATITVTASDGELTVSDTFSVTVSAVNDAPKVANPIADVSVSEDAADQTIDVSAVFADIDGDSLTLSAVSTDGSVVTTSLSGTDLTLSFPANANGAATVTVTADDGSLTVSDTFSVTVSAVNDGPTVANPIADVTVNEDSADQVIDLSGVFADVDSSLTLTALSSDGSVVATSLSGTDLTLSFPANANGTATVTVTASDGELTVSDTFSVTVSAVNDAPTVANPIADATVNEDAADQVIDLSGVFADVDSSPTLSAGTSDGSVVTTSLSGTELTLSFPANANGSATVTVTADDGSLTVSDTFSVTVSAVNDGPTVANPIADVSVSEDAADQVIDLSGVFADLDGDALTLTAVSSDGSVVTTSLSGTNLTLSFPANANGTATVTVTANDGALTVSDTFSVTVSAVNDAPTVANPITDVTVNEDAVDQVIDLSGVFADLDGDALTLSAVSSDGSVSTTSLSGTDLTLSFPADSNGTATVTVTANDGSLTVSDTFSVTVSAVNDAPTVANPIADVTVNEDAADQVIDLSGVFADVDSSLTLTAVSSDGSVVTTSLSGTDLTLNFPANANGTATITVTADDGSSSVSDTFSVTVIQSNQAPMVTSDGNITVNEGGVATASGEWSDPDGDEVTLSADIGTVTKNADGTWTWTYNTDDGPDDSASVTITAVDTGNESTEVSFDMTVNNVAPSVITLTSTAVTVEDAAGDGAVEISGSFFDPGNDTHVVTVNWGDGHVEVVAVDELNQLFSGSHTYANGGLYEISVTIVDSDGAAATQPSVTQAYVQGVGVVNGTLYLIGTDGDDHVKVRYNSRHDEIDVDMKLDFRGRGGRGCHGKHARRYDVRIRQSFDAAEIDHIVVFLGAGDDFYDGEVGKDHGCRHGHRRTDAISQIVFGGSGDDQIFTGIGNDFVDGGSGRDHIHSDDGRDVLVGGTGRDHIKGGRGDDLLIGGSLETDWENSFDLSAIDSALVEWANGDLADTMDILGNVIDDEERDDLFGDRGNDTYISGRYDRRRG